MIAVSKPVLWVRLKNYVSLPKAVAHTHPTHLHLLSKTNTYICIFVCISIISRLDIYLYIYINIHLYVIDA